MHNQVTLQANSNVNYCQVWEEVKINRLPYCAIGMTKRKCANQTMQENISILNHFPAYAFSELKSTSHFSVSIVLEREKRGRVWFFTGFGLGRNGYKTNCSNIQ